MQIRPVSDLRNKFPEIEKRVENGEPVYLTKNGYGSMVVVSLDQFERLTQRAEFISEFEVLVGMAKDEIRLNPEVDWAVVVRTKKAHTRSFVMKLDELEDAIDSFMKELIQSDDAEIKYMVCMCNNYGIDIPAYYLNKSLLEACPKNVDAQVILQGEYDFAVRTIGSMMPPTA